ncbi:ATP-binding cassette domain-containing protein [Adlercreutzia sp. ZJ304]|uniref:ABC transporter ATP-binding protein n=1 Tax=Adlercreutzia sp. ZJ304 TaxID=2709791 RepID=UPI0013EBF10B|nr:ATP-binding cassette domain-containing protein [Adlercreutzia sp. ZJ304]
MLEARNVVFRYGHDKPIYDNFSVQVKRSERLYLDARSGFGKTTLCRLLAGYEQPEAGGIYIDGDPLPQRGVCPVQLIGQHPERTLDARMRMRNSLAEAGSYDKALLARLGIRKEWLSRFPHELSGGELQRFCIARALMANPSYLIADEISTMLDAVTQVHIWNVILEECQRRELGLVFTTHSRSLADRIATRTLCLES